MIRRWRLDYFKAIENFSATRPDLSTSGRDRMENAVKLDALEFGQLTIFE